MGSRIIFQAIRGTGFNLSPKVTMASLSAPHPLFLFVDQRCRKKGTFCCVD